MSVVFDKPDATQRIVAELPPFEPLTKNESAELAVLLDNIEEHLKINIAGQPALTERYRILLRHWVDRLCQ